MEVEVEVEEAEDADAAGNEVVEVAAEVDEAGDSNETRFSFGFRYASGFRIHTYGRQR